MGFIPNLFSLKGRTALCTGATSGIGKHIAKTLAQSGANLILIGRNPEKLTETKAEFTSLGNQTIDTFLMDLSDLDQVENTSHNLLSQVSRLDILVNAAGINLREPWEEITTESWRQTLDINLSIPFFLARQCVPLMIKNNYGRIINIASLQSLRAFPNSIPYGASKGGVCQLTRAMAEAWSASSVTANAIAPGFFPTPLTEPVFNNPQLVEKNAASTACGRNGRLEDLEGPALFLASPASAYVTGQTLFVDGGFTAK